LLDRKIPAQRIHDRRAVMACNASDFAVASYSVEGLPEFSFSYELSLEEKGESSSTRELLAIQRTLQLWVTEGAVIGQPLVQTTLWWLTDNQNVKKMLQKGSGKLRIMKLVLDIMRIGRLLLLDLQTFGPIWVSRDNPFLLKAEAISKGIDTDIWEITGDNVAHLSALFGPFTVDLFATRQNAKCERFYSRSWEEGSAGVDAFAWDWAGEPHCQSPWFYG
jgi:hypothetical protein